MKTNTTKHWLYVTIFGTHTKAGRIFDISLIVAIITSLVVLVLGTIEPYASRYRTELALIEYLFTALFTVEYLLRLYCSPKPAAYAKSFYGVVDLLAILPTYLQLIIPNAHFAVIIRLLRVMRIFRVLKLVQYLKDSNMLMRSLFMARRKILIFFSMVAILVTIFGATLYVIEGPDNGFTSIPMSIYWAIVTITTVGYGDIYPVTALGKAVAALVMLLGYSILAVPTGIITSEMNQEMSAHRTLVKCPNCAKTGHENDALHCKHCGSELATPSERVVNPDED